MKEAIEEGFTQRGNQRRKAEPKRRRCQLGKGVKAPAGTTRVIVVGLGKLARQAEAAGEFVRVEFVCDTTSESPKNQ
jgi:hypothetical protein